MPAIRNATHVYAETWHRPDRGAETVLDILRNPPSGMPGRAIPEPTPGPFGEPPARARVNHGRWVADCGLPDPARGRICPDALALSTSDRRFYCPTCFNAAVGGHWRRVLWPVNWRAVETGLEPIANAREQNWDPKPNDPLE